MNMTDPACTEKLIQAALVKAMKEKDRDAVSVLKMIKTRVSTERGRRKDVEELPPDEILKIVRKEMKEIRETMDSLKQAGALDRLGEEENKLRVLEAFLPVELSEQEIHRIILEVVAETGRDNFGRVMKAVMVRTAGKADGKLVSEQVKKALS
jgi:uncharacterized protein YqeY